MAIAAAFAWFGAACGDGDLSESWPSDAPRGDDAGHGGTGGVAGAGGTGGRAGGGGGDGASGSAGLHASGNRIVDGAGQPVRLLGVNRSGAEYACVAGTGIFEGPTDDAALEAIRSWRANVVRVPLNEDCWLAINGIAPAYSGPTYQQAIASFVDRLLAHGLVPILDLHWSAPASLRATGQQPMPDRDHSADFWTQVANRFQSYGSVVFDLYNEPYPDENRDTTAAWTCWRDGGTCPGVPFQAAGMQELVDAVRSTGAHNLILLGGVQYANAPTRWLEFQPVDPLGNLALSWHTYNFTWCTTTDWYDSAVAPAAAQVPLVAGEIGEADCKGEFITGLMSWLDARNASYLGWVWNTWGGCLTLITDYGGTANGVYGQTFKDHLAAIAP